MATAAPEFQGALVRLADALASEAKKVSRALARLDQRDAMRFATDAYPEIATPYLAAAGDMSASWYEEQPTKSKSGRLFIASPADLPEVDQLAANARWSLTTQDPGGALDGSARRQVFNQARETILNNSEEEPGTKWIRHARSGACGFCRMLATRSLTEGHGGAPGLYNTEATATRNTHQKFEIGHDRCRCIIIPLRPGATYIPPDYLPQWLDDYYAVSRDADGRLLPPQTIADRMEAIGRERGDYGDKMHHRGAVQEDVVNLDQSALVSARHLTERNAARADELVAPARDVVRQAKHAAERVDNVVSKAATVAGVVKNVVDFADAMLGDDYPALRAVKRLVDDTHRALGSAAAVTGKAATVTRVAERTVRDTAGIAHGAKQIVDDVQHLFDEVQAIAEDARALAGAGQKAITDRGGAGKLFERANRATEEALRLHTDAKKLVDRARAGVESAQNLAGAVQEVPSKLTAPIRDVRSLANHVADVAGAAQMAGADARVAAATIRDIIDTLHGGRRDVGDEHRAPTKVKSERLDQPDAIDLPPLDVEEVDLPERQLAIERAPAQLAIERAPANIATGPDVATVPNPPAGEVSDWIEGDGEHLDALERIREADSAAEKLEPPSLPAETPDPIAAGVPVEAIDVEVQDQPATKGDQLRAALDEAKRVQALPDDRKSAQGNSRAATAKRQQRQFYNKTKVEEAQTALDAAIADGTADQPADQPKVKRAKSRPLADVEAERRAAGDAAIQKAVDDFEKAVASGDDDAIDFAADHMDAVEKAENARREAVDAQLAKIAEKHGRQRARREAAAEAEQRAIADEIGALLGDDATIADYQLAEAQVIARRTGKDETDVLHSIRKREFVRLAEVKGNGFEDTLKAVFRYEVHKAYMLAEEETRGHMLAHGSQGKFDPINLWYASDATARKHMSEEMRIWFDANGRITLPVMRAMILDGDENFRRRTVMNEDFHQ